MRRSDCRGWGVRHYEDLDFLEKKSYNSGRVRDVEFKMSKEVWIKQSIHTDK